jgi:hypothetical protein
MYLEYRKLKRLAQKTFIRWHKCNDKKVAQELYDYYLWLIRSASKIAPPVDEVWRMSRC